MHREPVRSDLVIAKQGRIYKKAVQGTRVTTKPEVRVWLKDNAKKHWFFYAHGETGLLWIAFHCHRDALLWKLAWH